MMEDAENHHGHLDTRLIPGTIHLVDLEGVMRGQHASASRLHDVVLIPSPSSDPDDPLNWSPRRKMLSTTCMSVYTLMIGISSAAVYSVLEPISKDTGLTIDQLNAGTGYMFLFFGVRYTLLFFLYIQHHVFPAILYRSGSSLALKILRQLPHYRWHGSSALFLSPLA